MNTTLRASIVGASGYAGGELLRLLLDHPHIKVHQVTSESNQTRYVHSLHPNLRGRTLLKFVSVAELEPCDVLFVSLPHKTSMEKTAQLQDQAQYIVDLSADFRLSDPAVYKQWYNVDHTHPELLAEFVYGIPEVNRERMQTSRLISGAGCNATATILGLYPLVKAGLDIERVVVDIKAGSSEAGNKPSLGSHHPERSGCVRSFAPAGHRHTAEVLQVMGWSDSKKIQMSVTAIEMVRGILATLHVFTSETLKVKDLWKIFRATYKDEPFMRIVKDRQGIYRYPEPKILTGSNYCDVGFELDPDSGRIVVISAIDNLMKGAAGNAVHGMNIMCGFPETAGLSFPGLHPI
ncbi:N-acetyl-gamma-glutamyl-phosphate reductase [candidate division KSB3 bacterium]|uniref:N-acetyl-gamma-glutamyl-phosphate reductase n=1 Tax=candidate division KSB3 bacterium TaxID=2044937 RepID=A0A9D5JVL5_9BACT|nr:N-acetyl-gamma-glutamyl-phosphate reductase [candidate division KSB3 bacterium]MBD3324970.1 N-acetyl-gamma-glutamyl-phosphate reductase [candidate division KSB3 bacterium]